MTTGTTTAPSGDSADGTDEWWRDAVIYQIYIRSFADGDGDGVGDIAGIRSRLPYLAALGVDAIWVNPWYPSPMADGGYDVADYRGVEPVFGDLDQAQALVNEAAALGLRVVLDIVPNHTSAAHAWFEEALAAGPGSAQRARYLFRPGRGPGGELPPNDWRSVFGGAAWTRVTEADGSPGEWYLHLFDDGQPDLDWTGADVREEFRSVLRFWFDRGIDGFRIDVAHGLAKDMALPDLGADEEGLLRAPDRSAHPHWDRDEVFEIYRGWRAVADGYDPPRMFCAEAWVSSPERLAAYVRSGLLHTAFNFAFVRAPWVPARLREVIDTSLRTHAAVGAATTWVLSNHDVSRHVSRYGRVDQAVTDGRTATGAVDVELGRRRARAAALLMLALPGGAYVYQGDELGLEEVENLPDEARQDPVWVRSGGRERGRDGNRVPLPWAQRGASYGFGDGAAWLPQPPHWAGLSVEAQEADRGSMLWLYRDALRLRRDLWGAAAGQLSWLDLGPDVVAFVRGPGVACIVNLGAAPSPLPPGEVVLASAPVEDESLPPDSAVWLRTGRR